MTDQAGNVLATQHKSRLIDILCVQTAGTDAPSKMVLRMDESSHGVV